MVLKLVYFIVLISVARSDVVEETTNHEIEHNSTIPANEQFTSENVTSENEDFTTQNVTSENEHFTTQNVTSEHEHFTTQNVTWENEHFTTQNVTSENKHFTTQNVTWENEHFTTQNVTSENKHFTTQNVTWENEHFTTQNVTPAHEHFTTQNVTWENEHFTTQNVTSENEHFTTQNVTWENKHFTTQNVTPAHEHFTTQNVTWENEHFTPQNVTPAHEHFTTQNVTSENEHKNSSQNVSNKQLFRELEGKLLQRLDYIEQKLDSLTNSSCVKQIEEPTNNSEESTSTCMIEIVVNERSADNEPLHPLSDAVGGLSRRLSNETLLAFEVQGDGSVWIILSREQLLNNTGGLNFKIWIQRNETTLYINDAGNVEYILDQSIGAEFSTSRLRTVAMSLDDDDTLELYVGQPQTLLLAHRDPRFNQIKYFGFDWNKNSDKYGIFGYGC